MSVYNIYLFYTLFTVFSVFLLTAAVYDGTRYIIPNAVVLGLAGLFPVAALLLPFETAWLSHIGAALTVFFVGMVAYRFRVLGAGDIKLITALSLWAGFDHLAILLVSIAVAGGAVTLILMLVRSTILKFPLPVSGGKITLPRIFRWGEPIPYAVSVAIASIYFATRSPYLLAYV